MAERSMATNPIDLYDRRLSRYGYLAEKPAEI
jgi:hypothetical protein